eukprot:1137577-Pelagomonas_calceolata.AAC.3
MQASIKAAGKRASTALGSPQGALGHHYIGCHATVFNCEGCKHHCADTMAHLDTIMQETTLMHDQGEQGLRICSFGWHKLQTKVRLLKISHKSTRHANSRGAHPLNT